MSLITGGIATMVPCVTNANPSQSLLGGGGGGGGAGPNLVISTLTVNDTGNITLDWNNGGGTLNFGFEATNTSSFILQQGIGVAGTKVAGPEGCIQVLEKDGGANQVFAPLQASGFEVCATAYPGGAFAGLYFSSIGSVLYSAVGQPLTIDAPAGVNVSSLTVSSINGVVPGGGATIPANLTASTLALNISSLTSFTANKDGNGNAFAKVFAPSTNAAYMSMNLQDGNNAQTNFIDVVATSNAGVINYGTTGGALSQIYMDATGVSISTLKSQALNVSSINGAIPGTATIPANLNVSTINVSSIASASILSASTVNTKVVNIGNSVNTCLNWNYVDIGGGQQGVSVGFTVNSANPGGWQEPASGSLGLTENNMPTFVNSAYDGFGVNTAQAYAAIGAGSVFFFSTITPQAPTAYSTMVANITGDIDGRLIVHASTLMVGSINGNPPALTSGTETDIGKLFSTLFAANPSLSTIVY